MSAERYPADLVLTEQDFYDSGWREVLSNTNREGYPLMWQAFSAAARQAMSEARSSHGKVLWLLADACSMMLAPKSFSEPFRPFFESEGGRSVIPDDFSESEVAFFGQIVDAIDDPWLKSRIADLTWLTQPKRDVRYALVAIDAYRSIALDAETWVRGGQECWARAAILARMLKGGAGDRVSKIETAIVKAFERASIQDGFLSYWLADLLETNGLGRGQKPAIARKLEILAEQFDAVGDRHRARKYFSAGARWFSLAGDEAKAAHMRVREAEGWAREAAARASSTNPSHLVAATYYESAIQIYRTIPNTERPANRVDERLSELRKLLSASGQKALSEMGHVKSEGTDVSKLVEKARQEVSGKTPIEALKAFCNLYPGVDVTHSRKMVIDRLQNHPLQALFPTTVKGRDGRTIAKRPGLSHSGQPSEEDEVTIRSEMVRDHGILVEIVAHSSILPALEILWVEHRLQEVDFISLASQSPIVPKDRVLLFGKALFSGYERDFGTALHLLIPQIENLVRHHLKQAGAKTSTLDLRGIENEIGLTGLMDLPEAEKVFGLNLSFEIKALFCDAFGPNLRNELAHGLLDDIACKSIYSVYAWWLALKLTFLPYWNATFKETLDDSEAKNV